MKLAPLLLAIMFSLSLSLVGLTSSQGVYDPWCDQDSDGDIDIFDIVPAASAYGTTGDSTKNVSVTNWPIDSPTFPENLLLHGAIFPQGETYRRDLIDSTTHHPPSHWPGVVEEADNVVGRLNETYRWYYSKLFVYQKISLEPYRILGTPTTTITVNVTTFDYSSFKFDFLVHLGVVSPEGTWVELAFLGNETLSLMGTFNPSQQFTITVSHTPYPPLDVIVEPNWRLGISLDIFGKRNPTYSDTDFWNMIMMERDTDDFVVDIPIVKNP
jgi:hypothetical protein